VLVTFIDITIFVMIIVYGIVAYEISNKRVN